MSGSRAATAPLNWRPASDPAVAGAAGCLRRKGDEVMDRLLNRKYPCNLAALAPESPTKASRDDAVN